MSENKQGESVDTEAGGRWVVLCDTNGGTLPAEIGRFSLTIRFSRYSVARVSFTHSTACAPIRAGPSPKGPSKLAV